MKFKNYSANISFYDMLTNMMLLFVSLFVLAFIQMAIKKEKTKTSKTEIPAQFLITTTWPKEFNDDVDSYLLMPNNQLVFFQRKNDGFASLEYDCIPKQTETIQTKNGPVTSNEHRELITIRKTLEGEYIMNVHMYKKDSDLPTPVNVRIEKINPYNMIIMKNITLNRNGEEKTIARFMLNSNGDVIEVNELDKPITTIKGI